jgi:hypothetical protein
MTRTQKSPNNVGIAALGGPLEQRSTAFCPNNQLLLPAHAIFQQAVILGAAKNPMSPIPLIRRGKEFSALMPVYIVAFTLLATFASAQVLTGTVQNATTNRPAAGDDVVLLSLGQGMEEAGRTQSDAKGDFSFKLDGQGPHLIRVIHQGVTYHRMAPPGTTSVDVQVYDVSKNVEGIQVIADIMRLQAGGGQLQVERTFAIQNNSKPPRTQMNEHNLEFYVPDGAKIEEGQAMTEGGQPVKSDPAPEGENAKNRYSFLFPLRPGETRFEVVYTVPYTGSVNIDPKLVYPVEHFVAIAPKSMEFAAANPSTYQATPYPGQPDANVEIVSNAKPGQSTAFKLSGEGALATQPEEGGQGEGAGSAQAESRPGGGLGPPIDAPPPTQKYQWWILGGLAAALIVGGVVVASRQQAAHRAARSKHGAAVVEEEETFEVAGAPVPTTRSRATGSRSSKLLDALKEELFDLEVEFKQGQISREEYQRAKAALDQTLERALKRESARQT